ncbi:MFS transporter [Coraliomargarita sp. W4R72]
MNKCRNESCNSSIGRKKKVVYGLGAIAENMMQNSASSMANPFFNIALHVPPGLLGIATLIFRLWDAITDPIMGWISDRTESVFGRRRPYIIAGAIFGGLLFALMWWCPRDMSTTFYFSWYMVVSLLFYSAFTVFGVPYLAMGYELSTDYHERTRIMSYRTWFQSVAGICIQWMFWMTQRDYFEDTVEGMRWVGIGAGALVIVMGVMPGLFLKERQLTMQEKAANREKVKLKHALSVLKVRPFRYILLCLSLAMVGMFTVGVLGFYINVYYVFGGDLKAASFILGMSGSFYHLICMASVPMIAWISTRIGKKNTLIVFIGIAVLGTLLKWSFFTPDNPWLQLVVTGLMAPGLSAVWTLLSSMTADVTDLDELENGTRREGSFGAIFGWTMKLGFALCFMIAGFVLELTGFDSELGGEQASGTLLGMRLLYMIIPAAGLIGAMLCVWRYPVTEERIKAARKELNSHAE